MPRARGLLFIFWNRAASVVTSQNWTRRARLKLIAASHQLLHWTAPMRLYVVLKKLFIILIVLCFSKVDLVGFEFKLETWALLTHYVSPISLVFYVWRFIDMYIIFGSRTLCKNSLAPRFLLRAPKYFNCQRCNGTTNRHATEHDGIFSKLFRVMKIVLVWVTLLVVNVWKQGCQIFRLL